MRYEQKIYDKTAGTYDTTMFKLNNSSLLLEISWNGIYIESAMNLTGNSDHSLLSRRVISRGKGLFMSSGGLRCHKRLKILLRKTFIKEGMLKEWDAGFVVLFPGGLCLDFNVVCV